MRDSVFRETPTLQGLWRKAMEEEPDSGCDATAPSKNLPPSVQVQGHKNGCLHKISVFIINSLEAAAYRWGVLVASRPWLFILSIPLICGVFSLGFLRFRMESNPEKMWLPVDSDFVRSKPWIAEHFPDLYRHEVAIVKAENVLTVAVLQQIYQMQERIYSKSPQGYTFEQLCARIPQLMNSSMMDTRFNPSRVLLRGGTIRRLYCNAVKTLPLVCWKRGLMELSAKNLSETISDWTDQDVVDQVNNLKHSPLLGISTDFGEFLGDVERNASGHIIRAGTTILDWVITVNDTLLRTLTSGNAAGTGDHVDPISSEWEDHFLKSILNYEYPNGISVYANPKKSFSDLSSQSVLSDIPFLVLSVIVMYIFVGVNLGRFTLIENRFGLAVSGILAIVLAVVSAVGLCSALGVPYSPIHNLMPLLVQGLGVDDMFVITQTFDKLNLRDQRDAVPRLIGQTLKSAGVSISITSLTDFMAFAIGGTTILPCLQSFCVYTAVAIVLTYVFQLTFFLGCFTLDVERVTRKQDAVCPCISHKMDRSLCSPNMLDRAFAGLYSLLMNSLILRILVLVVTVGLVAAGIYGTKSLEQRFDLTWFIPESSYLREFLDVYQSSFTEQGRPGSIFMGKVSYHSNLYELGEMVERIRNCSYILHVDSWISKFSEWLQMEANIDYSAGLAEETFLEYLGLFLYTPQGGRFVMNFEFDGKLECGGTTPPVLASREDFRFRRLHHLEQVPAMEAVKSILKVTNLTDFSAAWSWYFSSWEIDVYLGQELLRNLMLALAFVFLTTLLLIADLSTSLLVLLCVVITLVDVAGGVYYCGLTIEIVTSLNLILAIGLSVDYAAHIGYSFMKCQGNRQYRTETAVLLIGPAVLYGALSTALGIIFLLKSKSYVFATFFKVIFMSTVFGLFHGILFLPVILSFIGPPAYSRGDSFGPPVYPHGSLGMTSVGTSVEPDGADIKLNAPEEGLVS